MKIVKNISIWNLILTLTKNNIFLSIVSHKGKLIGYKSLGILYNKKYKSINREIIGLFMRSNLFKLVKAFKIKLLVKITGILKKHHIYQFLTALRRFKIPVIGLSCILRHRHSTISL